MQVVFPAVVTMLASTQRLLIFSQGTAGIEGQLLLCTAADATKDGIAFHGMPVLGRASVSLSHCIINAT